MNIISILLLLVAGTSVGIMFSLIVYESGSIWCSALVHGTWNIIMIGGILTIIPRKYVFCSVILKLSVYQVFVNIVIIYA